MAIAKTSNTDSVSSTDRAAVGNQPDNTPATGGTSPTGGGGGGGTFTNPMTALGDMIYGAIGPPGGTPARLAGNTSARRQWIAQTGTGSASAAPAWTNGPVFNVMDFGAKGDGVTNDTAAINAAAAAAAVAASGGTVYFPAGTYLTTGITSVTTQVVAFLGDAAEVCTLKNTHATNPTISYNGKDGFVRELSFTSSLVRSAGNPIISVQNTQNAQIVGCVMKPNGDCLYARSVNNFYVSRCLCKTFTAGTAVRVVASSLLADNSQFFTAGGAPCAWIQGTSSSHLAVGCGFTGAGSAASYTPGSITSTSSNFTVNGLPSGHAFHVGDYMVLSGMTPSAYNGFWRVASITSTTATVTTTINPGTTSVVGSAYKVPCCLYVDNSLGAVNESTLTGCIFAASGYPLDAISAGIYIDGRMGDAAIEGWQISKSYIDIGRVGVLLCGSGPSHGTTVQRWTIGECVFEGNAGDGTSSMLGQVWVEQCPAVSILGAKSSDANKDSTCKALYVYSDGTAPLCDGLMVHGCELGICTNYTSASSSNTAQYGIVFDGAINFAVLTGNIVWGQGAGATNLNSAITSTSIVRDSGNTYYTGSSWPANPVVYGFLRRTLTRVFRNTNFSSASGSENIITWDATAEDDVGLFNGTNAINVPAWANRIRVTAGFNWQQNSTGSRVLKIKDQGGSNVFGGSTIAGSGSSFGSNPQNAGSGEIDLTALTTRPTSINITYEQDSGSSLNIAGSGGAGASTASFFCVEILG